MFHCEACQIYAYHGYFWGTFYIGEQYKAQLCVSFVNINQYLITILENFSENMVPAKCKYVDSKLGIATSYQLTACTRPYNNFGPPKLFHPGYNLYNLMTTQ